MTLNPRTVWKAIPGISQVHVITLSLGRLQDLITGPGPITVIFSRLVTVSAKSISLLFMNSLLGRWLHTWQIQLLLSKRRVGRTQGWVQGQGVGWGVDAWAPPLPHTWWCRVLQSHSIPLNLPEHRVQEMPTSQPYARPALLPLPSPSLWQTPWLCPCSALSLVFSFPSVPAWTSHPGDKHTPWHSNQWATGQTTLEEQSLALHDSSPLSYQVPSLCQHWREASHENTPQKRDTRAPAGAAQYLHFVVECPSYISGVVTGWIHRAAAENLKAPCKSAAPILHPLWPLLTPQFQLRSALGYPHSGSFYTQPKFSALTLKSFNLQPCGRVYMYIH